MDSPLTAKISALVQRRLQVERRAVKRLVPGRRIVCMIRGDDNTPPAAVAVHNLSIKGAGLVIDREHPLGTVLRILLVNGSHTCAVSVELKVIRCFRLASGNWFVGGPFTRPLCHDELIPFMV